MDSIELVELLKNNKEKGLSCLYDQYAPTLNGIVTRIVPSEALAEEVLQQIFLRIAYSIERWRDRLLTPFYRSSVCFRKDCLIIGIKFDISLDLRFDINIYVWIDV